MNEDTHAKSITELFFDRILCDVPCSGYRIIPKAPDIWKKLKHDEQTLVEQRYCPLASLSQGYICIFTDCGVLSAMTP
jgi:16S rRNA C967 or C1407 C5-methylase (RsmB/RsmF family)